MKIGIDLGGTKTEGILIDNEGKELIKTRIKTQKNYQGTIDGIISVVYEFEKNFAKLIDAKYAVGVNSGTDAIKLSLKAINLKPGDEVITTANTFVATVGAINELGGKIVFVDCDDTFCMNVNLVEKKITKKTKAIIPVHLTGCSTNMIVIMNLAKKYKVHVISNKRIF